MPITDFFPTPESEFKFVHSNNLDICFTDSFAKLRIYDVHSNLYGYTSKKLLEATEGVSYNEMTFDFIMQHTQKYNFCLPSLKIEVNNLLDSFKSFTE